MDLDVLNTPADLPNEGSEAATLPNQIRVSWADVKAGRAYVRIPFVGKLLLFHWAGAPWSDKDPDACLHPLQVEVIAHRERERLVNGGSRLGKSVLGGCDGIDEAMVPGSKMAVVAQRYDHVGAEWQYIYHGLRKLFIDCPQAFRRIVFKHQAAYHDYEYSTIWGSEGRGYSVEADEGAALLGREFTRVVVGEGSHVSKMILEKRILRALDSALMARRGGYKQRETGKLSIYTTPKEFEGLSAAEWERVQKQTKRCPELLHYGAAHYVETVWIREASVLENPAYDRTVYEARRRSMSADAFEEQYAGKMTYRSGRVLNKYREELHTLPLPKPDDIRKMRLGVGIDTGAYTGLVLGGIDRKKRGWILGEVYTEQEQTTNTLVDFRQMVVEILGPAFGVYEFELLKDYIDLWVIDPASQHKIDIAAMLDVSLQGPQTEEGGKFELIPTLELVNDQFESNQLVLADTLAVLPDQLRKYIWKTVRAGQRGAATAPAIKEPRKEFDHLIDAMRFLMVTLRVEGPTEEEKPVTTFKAEWEQAQRQRLWNPLKEMMEKAEEEGGIPC